MQETVMAVFGEDYGTSECKFGPIWLGEKPDVVENRGYFPRPSQIVDRISGREEKEVVVGPDIARYLEAREDLIRLIYPMKNGVIDKGNEKAWRVVKEITRYCLAKYFPWGSKEFNGFFCVAALAAHSPIYMYEKLFDIHRELNEEAGVSLVNSVTIIPQPLAVAISHKATSCVVMEGGHGNTQITPISRAVISGALIPLNRGGADVNYLTAQILKDAGYGDLIKEEKFVRNIKEEIGVIPLNLESAIRKAKSEPERFRVNVRVKGTNIRIDLEKYSWQRFLLGEYVFNPGHEIYESYFSRGFSKPNDTYLEEGEVIPGTCNLADAIIKAVERCPIEAQPQLYRNIILSGGNFAWRIPEKLQDVAVDSCTKIEVMMREKGLSETKATATKNPHFSVWQGCIVYGLYTPKELAWDWNSMEGWWRP